MGIYYWNVGEIIKSLRHIHEALLLKPTHPLINSNHKDILHKCNQLQQNDKDKQFEIICGVEEATDKHITRFHANLWSPDGHQYVTRRWKAYNAWVKESPVHSAHQKNEGLSTEEHDKGFAYIPCPLCGDDFYRTFYHDTFSKYPVAQCSTCGFLYRNPSYTPRLVETVYNNHYLHFLSGKYSRNRMNIYKNNLENVGFQKITATFPRRRLLDIGCGHGLFLTQAREQGWEPFGLDMAPDCIHYAQKHFNLHNTSAGNLEDDSFEPGFFDAVTLWSVAAHLENPRHMFNKIHRVLRPGGILLIFTVDADSFTHHLNLSRWGGFQGNHLIFFTPDALRAALQKTGFSDFTVKYDNGYLDKLIATEKLNTESESYFNHLSQEYNLGSMMTITAIKKQAIE